MEGAGAGDGDVRRVVRRALFEREGEEGGERGRGSGEDALGA